MPYPMSSSKGYGGGAGSSGLGYSSIPSTSYMPGFSSMLFGSHNFSSGRSPLYSGSSAGSSLGLLGLSSSYSLPSYPHVSPYASGSSYGSSYGGYGSSSTPKSFYSPLPTISEHSTGPSMGGNKRRVPRTYIPVLPLPSAAGNRPALYSSSGVKTLFTEDIDVTTPRKAVKTFFTEDIDVTTPRKTAKPADISRKKSDEGYGTIRRGRTVIRLETKKLKENPYMPTADGEKREETPIELPKQIVDKQVIEDDNTTRVVKDEENGDDKTELTNDDELTLDDISQLSKDYSQVAKWYEEEMKKPMKKEKNAGDKFREKYMVHSRKNKYAGYRRPTLSDIRAQKAVVMKEIEERLKKLADVTPSGTEVSEDLKVEAQKLEKDKERLARLDKKMAKRFSRALKKAEVGQKEESSDEDSICVDRQPTVKAVRKLTGELPIICDEDVEGSGGIQGQRLTRKVTKRFFFPAEASSVVQPEIIEAPDASEPVDLFEKNILAQRQTIKVRATQKKVALINQRKSSASDLEIPGNLLSDKLCDVVGGEVKSATILEPPEEELSEEGKPVKLPSLKEGSGKKKKLVKKVGDPPAKRVPGNILQPLVVPPKDSDSILESPTEEEIESAKAAKNKKSVGKVNGLVSNAQKGLMNNPFLKNNLLAKPIIPNNKMNKEANKLTNETQAASLGTLPGKRTGSEVKPKPTNAKPSRSSIGNNNNNAESAKPVAEIPSSKSNVNSGVATTAKIGADQNKNMNDLPSSSAAPPTPTENQATKATPQMINEKSDNAKSDSKLEGGKKAVLNDGTKSTALLQGATTTTTTNETDKKALPAVAKLKPKLALDNKSSSFDGLKPLKLKLDSKSASFDANDDKNNVGGDKGTATTKKPLMKQGWKQQQQQGKQQETTTITPTTITVIPAAVSETPTDLQMNNNNNKNDKKKDANVAEVDKKSESAADKNINKSENVIEQTKKEPISVPKKEVVKLEKKENGPPKEENLKPIKKTEEIKAIETKQGEKSTALPENNVVKKICAAESPAKQDLIAAVKVEEKKQDNIFKKMDAKKTDVVEVVESNKITTESNNNSPKGIAPKTEQKKNEPVPVAALKGKFEQKKEEPTIPFKTKPEEKIAEPVSLKKKSAYKKEESTSVPKDKLEPASPPKEKPQEKAPESAPSKEKTELEKKEPASVPVEKLEEKNVEPAPLKEKQEQKTSEQVAAPLKEKSTDAKSPPASPKGKTIEEKQKPGVKSPPPEQKVQASSELKGKFGIKSPPPEQKVAPLVLKEKFGIKSPPQSPKVPKPCGKSLEEPIEQKKNDDDVSSQGSKVNTEIMPDEKSQSLVKPLLNGHDSPPPSSPPGKGAPAISTKLASNKQQAQKSPQPSETTHKENATTAAASNNDHVPSAKVENLGCSAETTTNGPEKKKNDSAAAVVITDLPDISAQMNKVGNLSTATASENIATTPTVIGGNSGQKSNSSTTNTVDAVNESSVIDTNNSCTAAASNGLKGGDDEETIEKLANPVQQSFIRKSLKRGSPRHSSESSISSSGSSTAKSESGSSTSSTFSAGSSAGSRRAPSPPIEDDSDEERVTICPAKTRPKYRKYEIEDFQFLKVLGKGSFGKVLLAELKGSDSYFAIKCLKKDVVLEDDDVECTMIERKVLLMGSKHPYLCHLFCTFQTESHLFFVMEYLNGGDLMFHIQQSGRFTEERARFYGAEIVSGLKFLHKRGVIYRDLKLDNILLDYEGHIRIADFGMCKLQIYLDRMADTFCGTPDYMSPEIIRGLRYNQCVDWWAFGVLMYEMLIGQSPFSGHDEDELFWSICNEPVHYPRFLCKESKRLLELLLEKDSSKRLGTVGCVHGDVKEQPFFEPIDWERLERRELEPPFKPKLKHSLDVQYFDTTFTKEVARLTPVDKEILRSMDQTQFEGFSYTNPHTTD